MPQQTFTSNVSVPRGGEPPIWSLGPPESHLQQLPLWASGHTETSGVAANQTEGTPTACSLSLTSRYSSETGKVCCSAAAPWGPSGQQAEQRNREPPRTVPSVGLEQSRCRNRATILKQHQAETRLVVNPEHANLVWLKKAKLFYYLVFRCVWSAALPPAG